MVAPPTEVARISCLGSHVQTIGGVIGSQPLVPGFITTGEEITTATGPQWSAVRSLDGHPFMLKVIAVDDVTQAQALADGQLAAQQRVGSEHLVRRHGAMVTADGRLAVVLDEVSGGSLSHLLAARGQLTAGETVTTVAPLFRALADLHNCGVVHGDLAPGSVVFTADGRPLIADLGIAGLLAREADPPGVAETSTEAAAFSAPELQGGAAPSPASDVYAMAALGWFCLTGLAPGPAGIRRPLTSLRPDTPRRLGEVLTACLATNPVARPSAGAAAVEVFEAAPAESVALASVSDPGAEITRRIRAAAAADSEPAPRAIRKRHQARLICAVVAAIVVALGAGTFWLLRPAPVAARPLAVGSASRASVQPSPSPSTASDGQSSTPSPTETTPARLATMPATMRTVASTTPSTLTKSQSPADLMAAPDSPRLATAAVLQALVNARAVAYVLRDPALLDLVYAPGAPKAEADKVNIATALKNGGTYLGLSFVIRDVAFLDGSSGAARIRATIVTPAYQTGQPDGRKIAHPQEILRPCIFSLTLTPNGWRIQVLAVP